MILTCMMMKLDRKIRKLLEALGQIFEVIHEKHVQINSWSTFLFLELVRR